MVPESFSLAIDAYGNIEVVDDTIYYRMVRLQQNAALSCSNWHCTQLHTDRTICLQSCRSGLP